MSKLATVIYKVHLMIITNNISTKVSKIIMMVVIFLIIIDIRNLNHLHMNARSRIVSGFSRRLNHEGKARTAVKELTTLELR